jgi:release factor glutamine methyltransferase
MSPWTLGGLLDWTARYLVEKGAESPRLDAEVLLAHAALCRRIELYTRHSEPASDAVRERYRELIRRRVEGCPVAYLVGKKEFFALEFEVTPDVLIPRPDSECVVMECLRLAKEVERPRVLDIGAGSGNLAIAIAHRHTGAEVIAVDISPATLAVAAHGVHSRIQFREGDLYAALAETECFDFVVSNPPYIAREDLGDLPVGVRDFEPRLALDGGPGGYTVFERLVHGAAIRLQKGGHLIVEIGAPQEERCRQVLASIAEFELAATIHDYSGHARVLRAERR